MNITTRRMESPFRTERTDQILVSTTAMASFGNGRLASGCRSEVLAGAPSQTSNGVPCPRRDACAIRLKRLVAYRPVAQYSCPRRPLLLVATAAWPAAVDLIHGRPRPGVAATCKEQQV